MRIYQIIIDPIINGQKLSKFYKVDIKKLHNEVLQEWSNISGEKYEVVKSVTVDYLPEKEDGYKYTREEYYRILMGEIKGHSPDYMNYKLFIEKFDLINGRKNNEFDEVNVYGAPWFGFYESRMIGNNSIWCNAPEYKANCENFIIMGFNYERGVSEAIEAFGHRVESTLKYCYPKFFKELNNRVGSIHIPFNAKKDYQWKESNLIENDADYLPNDYYNYSKMSFAYVNYILSKLFKKEKDNKKSYDNCEKWGCGSLGWFRYWFGRIPSYMWRMIIHVDEIKKVESIFN